MREIDDILAQGSKQVPTSEPAVFSARKSSGNRESAKPLDLCDDLWLYIILLISNL